MTDTTLDTADTAAERALSRRVTAWWGRLHLAVRLLLVALPVVAATVTAWAASQVQAGSVERLAVTSDDHAHRLAAVEVSVVRLAAEGAARQTALSDLRIQTVTLAESVVALREVTARLAGGVDALVRLVELQSNREDRRD